MAAQLHALGSSTVDSWALGDVLVFSALSMHFYSKYVNIVRFDGLFM
jgi:hypothetical protein